MPGIILNMGIHKLIKTFLKKTKNPVLIQLYIKEEQTINELTK